MKKALCFVLLLLLLLLLVGCTADSPGYLLVIDSEGNILTIDETLGAITSLPYEHQLLHDGAAFMSYAVDETLADGENITLVFKTMALPPRVHMFVEFTTLGGGNIRIWEGVTWTTGTGNLNPIYNRLRDVTMVNSGVLEDLTTTPTFTATNNILEGVGGLNTAGAIEIYRIYAWGKKEKMLAVGSRDAEGFVLAPDTQYAVVFTATGGANKAQIILNWLEVIHE